MDTALLGSWLWNLCQELARWRASFKSETGCISSLLAFGSVSSGRAMPCDALRNLTCLTLMRFLLHLSVTAHRNKWFSPSRCALPLLFAVRAC
uniref:Uncharacterized protein n=1 Tax=Triticum urartu TaxID=4572 RepID=A0A8R7V892_TRIUA